MGLQKLVLVLGPLLFLAGIAYFVKVSHPRQRLPMFLGWLVPGLGHWVVGLRGRAVFFAVQLFALWAIGLWLTDARCVNFDRHPIWALTQAPGGAVTMITAFLTRGLTIDNDNALYNVGCLYVGVAGLMNLVALCDLFDLTSDGVATTTRAETAA